MEKKYIKPEINVIEIELANIMAGSGSDGGGDKGSGTAGAKRFGLDLDGSPYDEL